jgi:hypothetical protein
MGNVEYEQRECFKKEDHTAHVWHSKYWCRGLGLDEDGYVKQPDAWTPAEPEYVPAPEDAPAILDARTAYGDKVQNQIEQAAMINAYLSGREVRPVDVPIIMVLIKCHRIGKMPDYKDSYDDVEGYLAIAKMVIGGDMIEATTAAEYMNIKANGQKERVIELRIPDQSEGSVMQSWLNHRADGPAHPYENVERDMLKDVPDEHSPNL